MRRLLGLTLLLAGMSVIAMADDRGKDRDRWDRRDRGEAPEISADQVGGALALVSGSLLVLRSRRKKA